MIAHGIGFGIVLTDEFGGALEGMGPLVALCDGKGYENFPWLFTCPSVEEHQFCLGFEVGISKSTDFKVLETRWHEVMTVAPAAIQQAWRDAGSPEPDVVFLFGHC